MEREVKRRELQLEWEMNERIESKECMKEETQREGELREEEREEEKERERRKEKVMLQVVT